MHPYNFLNFFDVYCNVSLFISHSLYFLLFCFSNFCSNFNYFSPYISLALSSSFSGPKGASLCSQDCLHYNPQIFGMLCFHFHSVFRKSFGFKVTHLLSSGMLFSLFEFVLSVVSLVGNVVLWSYRKQDVFNISMLMFVLCPNSFGEGSMSFCKDMCILQCQVDILQMSVRSV